MNKNILLIGAGVLGLFLLVKKAKGATMENLQSDPNNNILSIKNLIKSVIKISSPFGNRVHPVTKEVKFHNGIDIVIPSGTEIFSPLDGVVTAVYSNTAGGNQLAIKHTNYSTGYAHLTKSLVKIGDKVTKGQKIAISGNTGQSTGAHLHFVLKDKAGNYLDPAKFNQ